MTTQTTTTTVSLDFSDVYIKGGSQYRVGDLTAGYVVDWDAIDVFGDFSKNPVYLTGSYFLITAVSTVYNIEEMEVEFRVSVMNADGQETTYVMSLNAVEDMNVNRSRQMYGNGPKGK